MQDAQIPDPFASGFTWARDRARRHRGTFAVSGVGLAAASMIMGDWLAEAAVGLAAAALLVIAGTFFYCIVVAPYEQRNALRQMLSEAQSSLAAVHLVQPCLELEVTTPEQAIILPGSVTAHPQIRIMLELRNPTEYAVEYEIEHYELDVGGRQWTLQPDGRRCA